jgi:hypothetical protein
MTAVRPKAKSAQPCEVLLKLRPAKIDADLIRLIVGRGVVATHAAVAREFGLSVNTIKQSWASEGMPGEKGKYPLAEIVVWRLRYLVELEGRKSSAADLTSAQLDREQAEEELRKIKLQNDKLEREEQIASGKVIDKEAAETALRTLFAVHAERVMKVMAQLEPSLPAEIAPDIVATGNRLLRRELVGLSETSARDIIKEGTSVVDL